MRVDRNVVETWVRGYERAWRSTGTAQLGELFAPDVEYLVSPWARPIAGLAALAVFWDEERDGPDEPFTMECEIVAVDVDGATAVVRVAVEYEWDRPSSWRDLWILNFDGAGRCARFEEWPFAPEQPDGH